MMWHGAIYYYYYNYLFHSLPIICDRAVVWADRVWCLKWTVLIQYPRHGAITHYPPSCLRSIGVRTKTSVDGDMGLYSMDRALAVNPPVSVTLEWARPCVLSRHWRNRPFPKNPIQHASQWFVFLLPRVVSTHYDVTWSHLLLLLQLSIPSIKPWSIHKASMPQQKIP